MKKQETQSLVLSIIAVIVVGGAVVANRNSANPVSGRPEVRVTLAGQVVREKEAVDVDKAGLLNPGEILNWTITSHNSGTVAAQNYKAVGEIPSGTSYVASSASGSGSIQISYSIDGGKTFDVKPMLSQRQPDGTLKKIPAPATIYTQIRYEWSEPLGEGKQVQAFYQVRVK